MIVKSNFHFAAHSFFLLHIGYQVPVDVFHGITDKDAAKVVDGLGLKGADRNTSIEQVKKLYELFCKCDCTLLEVSMFPSLRCSRCNFHVAFLTNIDATCFISSILQINPIAETSDNKLVAADAKLNFDDNAAFRQKEIFTLRDPTQEDPREVEFTLLFFLKFINSTYFS